MSKKKTTTTKSGDLTLKQAMGMLGFLGSGKTMFSGMKMNLGVGDKALVLGKQVNMKGHAPQAKFAQLSDGSKLTLVGPNKGLIVKK